MSCTYSVVLLGACLAVSRVASAAVPPEGHQSPPAETSYQSAFADYRPYQEEPITDWRALNESVAHTGGHAGIMRGGSSTASTHPSNNPAPGPVKSGPARAPDTHGR